MSTLTVADLQPGAMAMVRAAQATCEARLLALRKDKGTCHAEEVSELEAQREGLQQELQWRGLMLEAEQHASVQQVTRRVEAAAAAFRKTLATPTDYAETSEGDGAAPVPYSDTDDYADLSEVEDTVDACIAEVRQLLCSASAGSRLSSPLAGRVRAAAVKPTASRDGASVEPSIAEATATRRRALLMLLVLSVHAGRLEGLCAFEAIPEKSNVPSVAADELREEVASEWRWALCESTVLTEEERRLWRDVVRTFLGPPFDSEL